MIYEKIKGLETPNNILETITEIDIKKYYVYNKLGYWSTRHILEER